METKEKVAEKVYKKEEDRIHRLSSDDNGW